MPLPAFRPAAQGFAPSDGARSIGVGTNHFAAGDHLIPIDGPCPGLNPFGAAVFAGAPGFGFDKMGCFAVEGDVPGLHRTGLYHSGVPVSPFLQGCRRFHLAR